MDVGYSMVIVNQDKKIKEQTEEIEKLREALSFYANPKHYDLFVRSHSSMGEYETSFIQDDGGQIARETLGGKDGIR